MMFLQSSALLTAVYFYVHTVHTEEQMYIICQHTHKYVV